ncbi:MAG: hypothetical protein AAGA25_01860 [Planctomycetota bacterium]
MQPPVWVRSRVPNGYWDKRTHRMNYMVWLRRKLRFNKRTDWYRLNRQHFLDNHGGGLLATIYKHSPYEALRDYAPNSTWLPWLMTKVPQGYWKDPKHRRAYMTWLSKQLKFKKNTDWYRLSKRDFNRYGGEGLLANYYRNSPINALREFKPNVNWQEWRFAEAPQRFWQDSDNRGRYMHWLSKQLRYRTPDDWCDITRRDFQQHHGSALLQAGWSPIELIRETFPEYDCHEWHFVRVPNGFWSKPRNRNAYFCWLGESYCGFTSADEWQHLTREDVRDTGGGSLLSVHYHNSMRKLRAAAARA